MLVFQRQKQKASSALILFRIRTARYYISATASSHSRLGLRPKRSIRRPPTHLNRHFSRRAIRVFSRKNFPRSVRAPSKTQASARPPEPPSQQNISHPPPLLVPEISRFRLLSLVGLSLPVTHLALSLSNCLLIVLSSPGQTQQHSRSHGRGRRHDAAYDGWPELDSSSVRPSVRPSG